MTDFDEWLATYAREHFLPMLRERLKAINPDPDEEIVMRFFEGDPGFPIPADIVKQLLEEE